MRKLNRESFKSFWVRITPLDLPMVPNYYIGWEITINESTSINGLNMLNDDGSEVVIPFIFVVATDVS